MQVKPREPPQDAYAAVRKVVDALAASRAYRTPALERANPDSGALTFPHRVALLPLDVLRREGTPLRTVPRGWRWLLQDADGRFIGAAEAVPAGETYRFGELNEGPFVAATGEALQRAGQLDLGDRTFEPLLLVAPAVYVAALWLKSPPGDVGLVERGDVLLVLPPSPAQFRPYAVLPPDGFDVLRQLARRVPSDPSKGG